MLARKIHRILAVFMIVLGLTMSISGVILKYPTISNNITFLNYDLTYKIHSETGSFFVVVLLAMMFSGSILFIFPYLKK